jgi:hypothetical protein
LYIAIAPPLPAVLGPDIAGAIVEVGEGVLGFSAGEKVYGCAGGVKDHGGTGSKVFSGEGEVILAIADSILRKLGTTPSNWTKRTNGFGLNCNVQTSEERQVHAMALRSRLVFATSAVVLVLFGISEWLSYRQNRTLFEQHEVILAETTDHAVALEKLRATRSKMFRSVTATRVNHAELTLIISAARS